MEKKPQVYVIGGGASGLMAAIFAARAGASVTLLEQNEKPGKKLLATGNGRCNFSNLHMDPSVYHDESERVVSSALSFFDEKQTMEFFHRLGLPSAVLHNSWVYPRNLQASSVLELLLLEAKRVKVKFRTNTKVLGISRDNASETFEIQVEGWKYPADSVILCNGSRASNIAGADGSGYELARVLGHTIVKPLPALTGLKISNAPSWGGVRFHGRISLYLNQTLTASEMGELQFTDYGISGIPVFQVSRFAIRALDEGALCQIQLDFFPEDTKETLEEFLTTTQKHAPEKTTEELFIGLLPEKLRKALFKKERFQKQTLFEIVSLLKGYSLRVQGFLPFLQAQICSGGVSSLEVSPETLESRKVPGLFFAGELLDIDGPCGGYNLQWAWSSGALAGTSAAKRGENDS